MRPTGPMGLIALLLLLLALPTRAQWMTQSVSLKAGWNAVYLHVDASHADLDTLLSTDSGNPIDQVWLWAPPVSTVQFVISPQDPLPDSGQWRYWARSSGSGTLQRLVPNQAYLVRVTGTMESYEWNIQGKPVPPSYNWTTTGLNFIGFPTVPSDPPTWETFLAQAPALQLNAEVFRYQGGELGATNPARLQAFRTHRVNRGQAYWIRSGTVFNRYFAPFELEMSGASGVHFGENLNASSFRLRNLTASNLTVTLSLIASEAPPAGQTNIVGVPPLQLRGALDKATLAYAYTNVPVGEDRSITLAPQGQVGSDVEVVLGLNRSEMPWAEGSLAAAVLQLRDSLGFSRVDLPVSAKVASTAGLWVGDAEVSNVASYLPAVARSAATAVPVDGAPTDGTGPSAPEDLPMANVQRPFLVRLILHNPGASGNAVLMQRAYYGLDTSSNVVVTTSESLLDPQQLGSARRISSSLLPWTRDNTTWPLSGRLGQATDLEATLDLAFDDHAANPFLHTYHPDHDGRDVTFKTQLPAGMESYNIRRTIHLRILPQSANVFELGSRQAIRGIYFETVILKGLARAGGTHDTRTFQVAGTFNLRRVSDIPLLRKP